MQVDDPVLHPLQAPCCLGLEIQNLHTPGRATEIIKCLHPHVTGTNEYSEAFLMIQIRC